MTEENNSLLARLKSNEKQLQATNQLVWHDAIDEFPTFCFPSHY